MAELAAMSAFAAGWASGRPGSLLTGLVLITAYMATVLLTVRRLRDSGWSVYWVLLMFFIIRPFEPFLSFREGHASLAIGLPGLELIPIVTALFAAGRSANGRLA